MKNWIIKSNKWYDNVKEPKRFLLFFFFVCIPIGLANAMVQYGYYWVSLTLILTFTLWRVSYALLK